MSHADEGGVEVGGAQPGAERPDRPELELIGLGQGIEQVPPRLPDHAGRQALLHSKRTAPQSTHSNRLIE